MSSSNSLALPLQRLLQTAAKSLPRETGDTARTARKSGRGPGPVVIIADTSGSMADSAGSRSKIDLLREAVAEAWEGLHPSVRRLVRFDSAALSLYSPAELTEPSGGTAMHLGLRTAGNVQPSRVIVISDGQPDDAAEALKAADELGCRIDVLYCGADSDATAIAFMRPPGPRGLRRVYRGGCCPRGGWTAAYRRREAVGPAGAREESVMLRIENHGPLLIASNFWESEEEAAGKFFLSTNAGAFRLLVPRSQEPAVSEMATAREVIVSRGPWPAVGREDAIELLFDDRTDTPFALHFSIETLDRLPLDTDVGREWIFSAWTVPRRRGPHKSLERPCWYRRVARIPCLQTRGFPAEVTAERKSWLKNVSTARRSAPRSGLAQSRSAARPRRKRPWNWSRNPRARRSAPCSWTAFRPRSSLWRSPSASSTNSVACHPRVR